MLDTTIIWDEEPEGNVEHIAEHGLTVDEVESVLLDTTLQSWRSRSTQRPCKFGWTHTGRYIVVLWDVVHEEPRAIYPVTAYEVPPPREG
jgi:uncharacterized DUF497 family protein